MDSTGWHAHRRAQKESDYYAEHGEQYGTVEQVGPMEESFIGGFNFQSPQPSSSSNPPRLPPKPSRNGTPQPAYPPRAEYPRPTDGMPSTYHDAGFPKHFRPPAYSQPPTNQPHLTAVERSRMTRVARMDPYLQARKPTLSAYSTYNWCNFQFMCGPLLKFDTIDSNHTWLGAALIVTADSGSIYEPHPRLSYEWDPDSLTPSTLRMMFGDKNDQGYPEFARTASSNSQDRGGHLPYGLGPHPADPHSTASSSRSSSTSTASGMPGPNARREDSYGQDIWFYAGSERTFTFWRFMIRIPLSEHEMEITYRINNGQAMNFFVPGRNQNMRWAAHSCNGFSAGINPDDFRGPGFQSGYDPVWVDLLSHHAQTPFHALVGGGDQLYCDGVAREPEMQDWVNKMKPEEKKHFPLTEEIRLCIDRFLVNHYCQSFRRGAFARANSSIPMVNMCDDHDPDDIQQAPVFRQIGARGYFFFLLFQCFINPEIDGLSDAPGKHVYQSLILGQTGKYIQIPSHSFLVNMGPQVSLLMLDWRNDALINVEHLVIQTGIPVAYPRMNFLETALESKFNPFVSLGRNGSLSGFVNKFNADPELLDDLNDHWTAKAHKQERNWLIEQLQRIAIVQRLRISLVSGDVHCAAVGVLKTYRPNKQDVDVPIGLDHRYMINVVTSAIVNTPPPNGVLTMVNSLASKTHKTMHHADTDETMMPLFGTDTDGSSRMQKYIMGKRNWCAVDWDRETGCLHFSLQIEKEKGNGITQAYPTFTPPPGWSRA
ncbi:hypothetical protein D9756_005741 [Leucocoprinus leucothites]|uniref:PhoD-like phosphatase domain-containing protein n=1 Tax=Leucocoprinus leucothites TaxID=201217 RepID=A0A8H5D717_9AGAR|nr:hypothetical protein D9756_005741 [Leucoagaricus leucothites]